MFGMVAATGIKILLGADLKTNRFNPYIIAISIGFGMIPLVADKFFHQMPKVLGPLLHSGILLTAITAVLLNLFFNGYRRDAGEGAKRMAMELVDEEAHVDAMVQLVKLEHEWVPSGEGESLYIRPTMIATEPALGHHTLALAEQVGQDAGVGHVHFLGCVGHNEVHGEVVPYHRAFLDHAANAEGAILGGFPIGHLGGGEEKY